MPCGICTPSPPCLLGKKVALCPLLLPPPPTPLQHSHGAGSASATQWSSTAWNTLSGTGMEGLGIMRSLIKPGCAKKPLLPCRPYQLWTGQIWLLDSAMAYLEERQQQSYHSHPPPCSPFPCQHPEQPQGLAARAEDTDPHCLPGASTHPVAPPSFTKHEKEKQVHEHMLHRTPTAGTRFPCHVPPSLLRASSCSSSVQLLLWGLFSIVLLCSTGAGGLLCHRASPACPWHQGSPPAYSCARRHPMVLALPCFPQPLAGQQQS